jgi:hypothetical protein
MGYENALIKSHMYERNFLLDLFYWFWLVDILYGIFCALPAILPKALILTFLNKKKFHLLSE